KLKGYYASISERQFRAAYDEASRLKGSTSEHLIGLLERRLDALVYRAKFVPTVFAARQFVSHGHVTVNGRRVTIPSYRLKVGDVVEVREKAKQLALVLEAIKSAERDLPDYVNADHNKMTASLTRIPALSDVPYPVQMEPNLVVEFYSR
ncbi:MAG: 30S ribosomal protein S4, partial [Proteobacteria bacterium]|nr:30S ribosomal protein S4 [Pseudomonadota bacterium]